ncbi:MAG: hypothetical protein GY722_15190 [bacterium]|nr:hypothetical protein [bacterium]
MGREQFDGPIGGQPINVEQDVTPAFDHQPPVGKPRVEVALEMNGGVPFIDPQDQIDVFFAAH